MAKITNVFEFVVEINQIERFDGFLVIFFESMRKEQKITHWSVIEVSFRKKMLVTSNLLKLAKYAGYGLGSGSLSIWTHITLVEIYSVLLIFYEPPFQNQN